MKLEDQVSPYELSKSLDGLGVKTHSLHIHIKDLMGDDPDYCDPTHIADSRVKKLLNRHQESCPAYTVAELMEMLPFIYDKKNSSGGWRTQWYKYKEFHIVEYRCILSGIFFYGIQNKNLTTALSEMLIWCIKEGHIKAEDL